jgi:hypothetical protein
VSTTPSAHEIREALRLDALTSPDNYEAFRDHIDNLPAIINGACLSLSSPLDSRTLTELRVLYMRSAIGAGVLDEFDAGIQSDYLDMVKVALRSQPDTEFESMLITPPSVIASYEEKERMLNSPDIVLSDELKKLYQSGTLTIGDAVRLQPGLFIHRC